MKALIRFKHLTTATAVLLAVPQAVSAQRDFSDVRVTPRTTSRAPSIISRAPGATSCSLRATTAS